MRQRRIYAEGSDEIACKPSSNAIQATQATSTSQNVKKKLLYTKLSILGEGTYGIVYKALNNETGEIVAIKKLHLNNVKDGVPTTTIRELSTLMHLADHENIVRLRTFKFDFANNFSKPKLLLELEYCEYDLRMFCKRFPQRRLPLPVIEKIIKDLVIGTAYCHSNRIIHRDLKPSNLLVKFHKPMERVISEIQNGRWDDSWLTLKLADFGLARTHYVLRGPLTHEVITLWYRAPEILLGCDAYGTGVDTWSIGCIVAELLYGRPLFTGDTEVHTLFKMFQFLGTPNEITWPGIVDCPEYKKCWPQWRPIVNRWERLRPDLAEGSEKHRFQQLVDFCNRILKINPNQRAHIHEMVCHSLITGNSMDGTESDA